MVHACEREHVTTRRGFRLIHIHDLTREIRKIDIFERQFSRVRIGLRDLQQRAERPLHALQLAQRRFHHLTCIRDVAMLQRFFDSYTRAIERCTQVVSGAVEGRT